MLFGEKILNYWDDIMADLAQIVAIPSVCSEPEGDFPFGKNAAMAVDKAMELSESYGFKTKNVGYYACHAELGEGEENAVVMAHLDVVPEGEGWDTDPYTLTAKDDGYIYGRGVSDNKGPAIIALHCLRAIKDSGIVGKRKLRVVMGSGEEIGMADMEHYFASEQLPTMGFTPDASYGICNCEKGILHFTIKSDLAANGIIKSFKSGTVVNAVPYKADAEVICTLDELEILKEAAYKSNGEFIITNTDNGAHILSKGIASHASMPNGGKNAAAYLIDLLYSCFADRIGNLLCFCYKNIGLTTDGSQIGVAFSDEPSGPLTFNLGLINIDESHSQFSIDIRYPATMDGNDIVNIIETKAAEAGLVYCDSSIQNPLYLPADGSLVTLLSSAYEDVTGEKCEIFSMGGGTYARQMAGKGVAFGAGFKDDDSNAHNCNEKMCIDKLKLHAQICLEAMYRMYIAE